MAIVGNAYSDPRDITVVLTGAPFPIDFVKAVAQKVEIIEAEREAGKVLDDLTEQKIALTGKHPFVIYAANLTSVEASGTYTFEFLEEATNVDNNSNLP